MVFLYISGEANCYKCYYFSNNLHTHQKITYHVNSFYKNEIEMPWKSYFIFFQWFPLAFLLYFFMCALPNYFTQILLPKMPLKYKGNMIEMPVKRKDNSYLFSGLFFWLWHFFCILSLEFCCNKPFSSKFIFVFLVFSLVFLSQSSFLNMVDRVPRHGDSYYIKTAW